MSASNKTSETNQAANSITIEPDQNVFDFAPQIASRAVQTIVLVLPKFTDGRAYSQAVTIRKRLRFKGQLKIVGDVLVDQVLALARLGFDQIELRHDQSLQVAQQSLLRFSGFYQDSLGYFELQKNSPAKPPLLTLAAPAHSWSLEDVCPA
jgi:uncharacterized protein (DUF934 family)